VDAVINEASAELDEQTEKSFKSAMLDLFPEFAEPKAIKLIAWSGKIQLTKEIPHFIDDVIISVGFDNETQFLVSLRRFQGSDGLSEWVHNMKWTSNDCDRAVEWRKRISPRFDSEVLASFIESTNFGLNELFDDRTKTISIILYSYPGEEIDPIIKKGISQVEKSRRRDRFMEMNASPADKDQRE